MTSDKKPFSKIISTIVLSFMFIFIHGCDTTETTNGTVSLSFHSGSSLQKITDGTIELTEVKILLRDVKLKMDDYDGHDGKGDHENGDDDSYMIRVGPFVVNLNLNGMTTDFIVANIPTGYYEGVKFKIHQIQGSEVPPDPEFKEGEDNSKRYSVIVKGLYNSEPFIYKSKKPTKQHIDFEPPIFVEENGDINLTITLDPYSWFYKDEILLDPTDPANENDIDNNIKESFKEAYEDADHNGKED